MIRDGFFIGQHYFLWGTTIDDVSKAISGMTLLKSYIGWPNIRVACDEALGMPALVCEVRGPALNRPVMQVSYEMDKTKLAAPSQSIDYWMKKISKIMGRPSSKSRENVSGYSNPSDRVAFYATWYKRKIQITLSVYGGERKVETGFSSAGLYIDWTDEKLAAKPYLEELQKEQSLLEDNTKYLTSINVYQLEEKQSPYYSEPDYDWRHPLRFFDKYFLRKSHKALYKDRLLETPDVIRRKLDNYSAAIWEGKDSSCWGVSTQKDSVYFKAKGGMRISFQNVLPAKGPGGMYLQIGDLYLSDKANSEPLKALVAKLEKIIGYKIQCSRSYDC